MKLKFLVLVCALLAAAQWVCAQASQTMHSAFAVPEKINQLRLDFGDAQIDVRKTNATRISVEYTVRAQVPNDKLLGYLMESGRYELQSQVDETLGTLTLGTKKNNNVLMVKGQPCKEEFTFIVYVPASVTSVLNLAGEPLSMNR